MKEISADGAYYSEENTTYAEEQNQEIHYTGFPGKKGRYQYERTPDGVRITDLETGQIEFSEQYKPGRYRFRVGDRWHYFTEKDITTSE